MSQIQKMFLTAAMAGASLAACAQTSNADHAQHHPGAAASAPVAAQPAAQTSGVKPATPTMDSEHMKAMQETHQKAMSAKTPEERQTAMAEHMKLMHGDTMPMMKMGGEANAKDAQGMQCAMMSSNAMVEQRLAHMESMMQTLMERLPATPAKSAKPAK